MASAYAIFLLLIVTFEAVDAQQYHSNLISLGSSLSPTIQPTSWHSPSGRFAFGFYQQGSGFLVGIWLVGKPKNIITWTANRDDPPASSNAKLNLTMNGKLLLRTDQGKDKLIADTQESASCASMLDSGNFVLYNKDFDVIWESFNFPTDTILGGQILYAGGELFSNASETNSSTGQFCLKLQEDGNLALYPINTIDTYWTTTMGTPQNHLYLNYTEGTCDFINNTDLATISTSSGPPLYNNSIIYRLTVDYDGFFGIYSHEFDSKGEYETLAEQSYGPRDQCLVKSFCGFNSYCTMNDSQPVCLCLPGTDFIDQKQTSRGCEGIFSQGWCKGLNKNTASYNITPMANLTWDDHPYFRASMSEEDCKKSCMEDCNCDAALYESDSGYCMRHKLPLKYARRDEEESSTAFLKVHMRSIKGVRPKPIPADPLPVHATSKKALVLILIISLSSVTCSCAALAISGFFILKLRVFKYKRLFESGNSGLTREITLNSFSYSKLKKATNGFSEQLGKGSFGAVYKGTLYKGKMLVAVKRLEKVMKEGEREFHAEMRVIGRTHHKNLVRLLGFCADDSKRLLVYEYMSNGSLADLLFRAERHPEWNERVRIALDVARGILYLHEECEAPIIHCDIKPQNILMDDFWTAKISDFGLAKLLMPDQTRTFTVVRGTRGYLAPEWQRNTPISVKVDVYSYGIVLLETICCRRNMDVNASKPEEIVLSYWVYKCFIARELDKLVLGEEVDKKIFEKMVKVALWCIQDEPTLRPSMKCVVMMLEGSITDISIPPCPTSISA